MKATETNFLKFLQQPKQFVIPIYQRTYSWTLKQCEQLWHNITRAALHQTISGHFIGSVVYIERGLYQVTSVPQLLTVAESPELPGGKRAIAVRLIDVFDNHASATVEVK